VTSEQEQELRRLGRAAVLTIAQQLIEEADELVELAVERAATVGMSDYGDTSYHKPVEYLEVDVMEELADAIFYQHIILIAGATNEHD
jgi:phosphoribosyl-ATP pyrophosphohydrolase